MTFHVRRLIYL